MVTYDPKIIQTFAERLYSRARTIAVVYTVVGVLVGGIGGFMLGTAISNSAPVPVAVTLALVLGLMCCMLGLARGFTLRLVARRPSARCRSRRTRVNPRPCSSSTPSPYPSRG